MTLEHLWAGWRAAYVESVSTSESVTQPATPDDEAKAAQPGCVFCRILASNASDAERAVVHQTATCAVLLNAYPYATGHLLVMPTRHVDDLELLTAEESSDLWLLVRQAVVAVREAYHADGLNIGVNLGRAAGAGIPAHLHFHVVPRWIGDTNFMTTVASVRVMPESLDVTWKKLSAAWPTSAPSPST